MDPVQLDDQVEKQLVFIVKLNFDLFEEVIVQVNIDSDGILRGVVWLGFTLELVHRVLAKRLNLI
jgi:hypothetical protein